MLTGSGFRGISGASGGTTQDSPTNYPLVQLRSMVRERTAFFRTTPEPAGSATGLTVPSPGFIVGPALVTVFVNGIPSEAAIVHVENRPAVLPPVVLSIVHETGGTRVRWQDFSGGLFSIQYSDTLSSWRLVPGEFRATNSVIEFFDFTQPIPPRRFYRPVRVAP